MSETDHSALLDAIAGAAKASDLASRLPRTVIVRSSEAGSAPLVLDVLRLPARARDLGFTARVLVIAQGAANVDSRRRLLLQTVYQLTAAETEVALRIAEGHTAEAIAATRGVAIATVRAQIKGILTKLGLRRQVELVARLAQL